jgi:hypothetical protein
MDLVDFGSFEFSKNGPATSKLEAPMGAKSMIKQQTVATVPVLGLGRNEKDGRAGDRVGAGAFTRPGKARFGSLSGPYFAVLACGFQGCAATPWFAKEV